MNYTHLRLEQREGGINLLWLDVPERAVNVLNSDLLQELGCVLDQLAKDSALRGLVIASAKPAGFLAGADVRALASIASAEQAASFSAQGQQLFDRLEKLPIVSVALIHGPCLGGGLELALACDYRLVIDQWKTQLGLPEVELGLIPAWGGTQRLPHVVGIQPALRIILAGKRLNAAEAGQLHLADLVLPDQPMPDAILQAIRFLEGKAKRTKDRLLRHTWKQTLIEGNLIGRRILFGGAARQLRSRVPHDMPAPAEALAAIRAGVARGKEAGLECERQAAGRLATSPACRNLIRLFLAREEARKLPAELRERARPIQKVGIVGAGTMGAGIAQLAALKGCQVVIQEANAEALGAASLRIANLFRQAVDKRAIHTVEMVRGLNAIKGTLDWKGFEEVDLAIEAVVEELAIKQQTFADLEKHTRPTAILASNTSSLLIENLQEGRQHPERIAGLHFFHPVHKMPLIEVVRAPQTSEATIATLMQWASDAGKTPVAVKDGPGFVVNRVLMPYLHEARLLAGQGIPRKRIDGNMRRFGMPLGPLEMIDLVGPALLERIEASLRPHFGQRFEPQKPGRPTESSDAVIRSRLVLPMVNEAAAVLGEGLAADAAAIDLAMVLGTGWAPHRGGPLRHADDQGLKSIVGFLDEMVQSCGQRFEPCPELRRRAEAGTPFYPLGS